MFPKHLLSTTSSSCSHNIKYLFIGCLVFIHQNWQMCSLAMWWLFTGSSLFLSFSGLMPSKLFMINEAGCYYFAWHRQQVLRSYNDCNKKRYKYEEGRSKTIKSDSTSTLTLELSLWICSCKPCTKTKCQPKD